MQVQRRMKRRRNAARSGSKLNTEKTDWAAAKETLESDSPGMGRCYEHTKCLGRNANAGETQGQFMV